MKSQLRILQLQEEQRIAEIQREHELTLMEISEKSISIENEEPQLLTDPKSFKELSLQDKIKNLQNYTVHFIKTSEVFNKIKKG